MNNIVPVGVSNRHIHLSQKDVEALFGAGYELTPMKALSQPGEFAAEETVTVIGPKHEIHHVRILGPIRARTQVEISRSDSFVLGVKAPIRMSGDLAGTPGITLAGPAGEVKLEEGVIVAQRHIHMTPQDAERFGVKDKDVVQVKTMGERPLIFDKVMVRVHASYGLDFHVDTDEANAAGLQTGDLVEILGVRIRELQLA
ncbi:phosphate propanoyltransferase [Aneurinibacillus sp. REN35]|uniref:phosphate propanoyltransferase n=1 Tax=Aneurinibacillus sp. REN35 TaxID=3237286 RepID=UPI003527AEFA